MIIIQHRFSDNGLVSNTQQAIILINAGKANRQKHASCSPQVLMQCNLENIIRTALRKAV